MTRTSNRTGANDNGGPTWAEQRRRDSYGRGARTKTDNDDDDETSET